MVEPPVEPPVACAIVVANEFFPPRCSGHNDNYSSMMLAKVDLFEGLTEAELAALAESSVQRQYPKNTVILNENDSADSLYIIESGRVKVYCSDRNGKEYIVNTMGPGEYFGELALLDDERRSASVRTMEKSGFTIVYKDEFNAVLDRHPNIARTLARNLARRIRRLTRDVKSLALQDVYGRVSSLLTRMARPPVDGAAAMISDKLTQQDIADRVGASREMVARILKDLTIGGYIEWQGRHIVLCGKLPENY